MGARRRSWVWLRLLRFVGAVVRCGAVRCGAVRLKLWLGG